MRILCVCLGNICRSPMAEGVIRARGAAAALDVEVDSAGTGGWHVGNPPDARGLQAALARGYDNRDQRARQVAASDFHGFDLILAMDRANLRDLQRLQPDGSPAELRLFHPDGHDIPDPYYGGPGGFETTLDMIEDAADHLVSGLTRQRGVSGAL